MRVAKLNNVPGWADKVDGDTPQGVDEEAALVSLGYRFARVVASALDALDQHAKVIFRHLNNGGNTVPTTQLAKMSFGPKFVELTADVLRITLQNSKRKKKNTHTRIRVTYCCSRSLKWAGR